MSNWYKSSSSSSEDLNNRIKKIIRDSSFFQKLFDLYHVSLDKLDGLTFSVQKIDGRNAQSDSENIIFNSKLFKDGRFFEDNLHFLTHEICHWLHRQRDKAFYFSDPEEKEAFAMGMTFLLLNSKSKLDIIKIYFPIIREHFKTDDDALEMFNKLFAKAQAKVKDFR